MCDSHTLIACDGVGFLMSHKNNGHPANIDVYDNNIASMLEKEKNLV